MFRTWDDLIPYRKMRVDAAPLRRFPRGSAGSAAFEGILALVAGDRGVRPFENGSEPWTARGVASRP